MQGRLHYRFEHKLRGRGETIDGTRFGSHRAPGGEHDGKQEWMGAVASAPGAAD